SQHLAGDGIHPYLGARAVGRPQLDLPHDGAAVLGPLELEGQAAELVGGGAQRPLRAVLRGDRLGRRLVTRGELGVVRLVVGDDLRARGVGRGRRVVLARAVIRQGRRLDGSRHPTPPAPPPTDYQWGVYRTWAGRRQRRWSLRSQERRSR